MKINLNIAAYIQMYNVFPYLQIHDKMKQQKKMFTNFWESIVPHNSFTASIRSHRLQEINVILSLLLWLKISVHFSTLISSSEKLIRTQYYEILF